MSVSKQVSKFILKTNRSQEAGVGLVEPSSELSRLMDGERR